MVWILAHISIKFEKEIRYIYRSYDNRSSGRSEEEGSYVSIVVKVKGDWLGREGLVPFNKNKKEEG